LGGKAGPVREGISRPINLASLSAYGGTAHNLPQWKAPGYGISALRCAVRPEIGLYSPDSGPLSRTMTTAIVSRSS
jgi:hypothetical protein